MLFHKMSRNNHNIRKKPIFSSIFQQGENFVPFRNLKILTPSKNTLQNLTMTNAITNVPKCTTVQKSVPYGTLLKGDTLRNYRSSPLNTINSALPLGGVSQTVKPSEMNTFQCQQKNIYEDPILTPMQPYSHCSKRQFTNVTNCTKFVTFLRKRFTMKLQEKHNEFEKYVK